MKPGVWFSPDACIGVQGGLQAVLQIARLTLWKVKRRTICVADIPLGYPVLLQTRKLGSWNGTVRVGVLFGYFFGYFFGFSEGFTFSMR